MINCTAVATRLAEAKLMKTASTKAKTAQINTPASTTHCHVDIRVLGDVHRRWKDNH